MAEKDEIALDSTGLDLLGPNAHTKKERDAILDREAEIIRKGMTKVNAPSSNKSSPSP